MHWFLSPGVGYVELGSVAKVMESAGPFYSKGPFWKRPTEPQDAKQREHGKAE
jgi:hypothetical protein